MVFTDPPFSFSISGYVTKRAHRDFVMVSGETRLEELQAFLRRRHPLRLHRLGPPPRLHSPENARTVWGADPRKRFWHSPNRMTRGRELDPEDDWGYAALGV